MGELIVGVLLGPAVLGWIQPGELIQLLAEIGIFFLMFHAGIETQPVEFYQALKRSMGVAGGGCQYRLRSVLASPCCSVWTSSEPLSSD